MTEDKCFICGEQKECSEIWDLNFCEECFHFRLEISPQSYRGIVFQNLISRIDVLEEEKKLQDLIIQSIKISALFDVINNLNQRLSKLEFNRKD